MRVAREWRVPYSALGSWTAKDVALSVAYLAALDDIGPCGHPHSKSTQPGYADDWQVTADEVCETCAKLEDFRRVEEPEPGAVVRLRSVWELDV